MTFKAGCSLIWASGMGTELAHKVLMRAVCAIIDRAGAQIAVLYFDGRAKALLFGGCHGWADYGRTVRLWQGWAGQGGAREI